MERRWILHPIEDNGGSSAISWDEICDLPCFVRLLQRRGFASSADVHSFLQPRLRTLSDPFLLPQMRLAVDRILRAVDAPERIVLFGDYDVDGVTSLALLAEQLQGYGAKPALFLPLRMEEGYGLSRESVERCLDQHQPQLLIAIDCGTSSIAEIADLRARGVDVIVIDHHEPKTALPNCVALVNPKAATGSDFTYLCSVGLVFKLCHALLKTRPIAGFDLKKQLDLVALGTVADIVPLEGENRALVLAGAREIAQTKRLGLRRLMKVSGVKSPVAPEDIGFRLGPRLNAAGRLQTAESALRLLLTQDDAEAERLAELLDTQNRERQAVEKKILAEVEAQLESEFDPARDAAIVAGARGWHPGVLGIVASRIARKVHRPTIVIGFDESGAGKGSGRSIEGFSLVSALGACAELLEKFGGHEMAAGLALNETNLATFRKKFQQIARERLTDEQLQPCLYLDGEVGFADLDFNFLRWHERLQPFGSGNAQPLFVVRGVVPAIEPQVLKERHLSLRLRHRDSGVRRAIFFDGATSPLPPAPWDVAFQIKPEEYEGMIRLQLYVKALRASAPLAC